jgi:lysophospholipase L1-like esterase
MDRRPRSRWSDVALAAGTIVVVLAALDRTIAWTDLGYRAARARPNDDRRLGHGEFDVRVVTNALGFRDARLPSPKPAGAFRVVALGDSFTQGYGVEEPEAYPRRLERLLSARMPDRTVEVVNLGVPGTSPRDYVSHLADPGLAYHPDLVLVGVMANDVQDVWIQRRFGVRFAAEVLRDVQRELADARPFWRRAPSVLLPALYPFVWTKASDVLTAMRAHVGPGPAAASGPPPPHGRILPADRWRDVVQAMGSRFGRGPETAQALAAVTPARAAAIEPVATGAVSLESEEGGDGYLALLALVEPRLFADAVLLPAAYDDAWRETAGYLRAITRIARRAGSRVVLVYVPAIHQVTAAARPAMEEHGFVWDPRTLTDTSFPDRLRRFGEAEDVPVVDLLPTFRAAADRNALYFPRDGHWTAAGHALAATTLANATSVSGAAAVAGTK